MRVCVIGAGFAGLAASEALADAGVLPIVLEARERVGGRVWSQRLDNGAVIERGAEFVERNQTTLLATLERLGLRLAPTGMSYSNREPRGVAISQPELQAIIEDMHARIRARPDRGLGITASRFLSEAQIDDWARQVIAARLEVTCACPADRLSARMLEHIAFVDSEGLRIAGGNQGLALGLAAKLGSDLHLGCPVDAVSWSEHGVRVHAAGAEVEADACVVAVPVTALAGIRFDPPLPEWKRNALDRVSYGHAAKLFVPLVRVPAPSAVLHVGERFWTWTGRAGGDEVQPVVNAFAGSAPALARLRVADGPATWLESLRALRPDLEMRPEGAVLSTWSDDPWVRGAYSVRTVETLPGDDELLARPVDRLHFAGEHTAGAWSGLMEGALHSGQRAAQDILATAEITQFR
jgi:monoamine oxidase